MNNFKSKLLKKITKSEWVWLIAGIGGRNISFVRLANLDEELKMFVTCLAKLETKSKKLGLTHLDKIEKRYLL